MTHNGWHELLHLGAAAVLLVVGGLAVWREWRPRPSAPTADELRAASEGSGQPPTLTAVLRLLAVTLSLAAGAIHLATAPSHLRELGLVGLGFVAAGAFQIGWAVAWAVRRTRPLAVAGMLANSALLGAWAVSRTVGLPLPGPAGQPESIGVADGVAVVLQVVLVALLAAWSAGLDGRAERALRRAPALASIVAVPAVGVVFLATTLGVSVALGGHGHGDGGHGPGAADHAHPAAVDDAHSTDGDHGSPAGPAEGIRAQHAEPSEAPRDAQTVPPEHPPARTWTAPAPPMPTAEPEPEVQPSDPAAHGHGNEDEAAAPHGHGDEATADHPHP